MAKRSVEADEGEHGNNSSENKRHKSDTEIGNDVTAESKVVSLSIRILSRLLTTNLSWQTDLVFSEIRPLWKGIENVENLVVL